MKKLGMLTTVVLGAAALAQAQYNGKWEGWSTGYIFTGSVTSIVWKAYTHVVNFQVTVSSSGTASTNDLAVDAATFVSECHKNNSKALVCIGGQGQSKNFSGACANATTQTKLINSILNIVRQGGYDGVDMDWEAGEESDNAAMVTKFKAFHKELRDSVNAMNPKPMMTAAVSTDWYPNCTASIAPYVDQLNNMSYYDPVTKMDALFKPVLDLGVSKALQGVGFGFDTDGEVTAIADVLAKCRYAIDNGYGGIMVWDINNAPAVTSDSISKYVNKNLVTSLGQSGSRAQSMPTLYVRNNVLTGTKEITYSVPSSSVNGTFVDLGMYDMKGNLVKTLVNGYREAGVHNVRLDRQDAGASVKPGNYVVKLATGSSVESAKAVILK